jgi:hypothetical protein
MSASTKERIEGPAHESGSGQVNAPECGQHEQAWTPLENNTAIINHHYP